MIYLRVACRLQSQGKFSGKVREFWKVEMLATLKSQGQTFKFVGMSLRSSVFMHDMLYVAFSRVKRPDTLKVLFTNENPCYSHNIVFKEVFG